MPKDKSLNRLSLKLGDLDTSAKSYWSIINNFHNKKVSTITPPLFNVTQISDFKQLFNSYFSSQRTPSNTSGKLLVSSYKAENRLDSVDIKEEDIYQIIKNLISSKDH